MEEISNVSSDEIHAKKEMGSSDIRHRDRILRAVALHDTIIYDKEIL